MISEHPIYDLFQAQQYGEALSTYGADNALNYAKIVPQYEIGVMNAIIDRQRRFARLVVKLSAGGPDAEELIRAIEEDTLNPDALYNLMAGYPFKTYTYEHNMFEKPISLA